MSSYQFGSLTDGPYDDLWDMIGHENQQRLSDPAVFQKSCSIYTISHIPLLAYVRTVVVDF